MSPEKTTIIFGPPGTGKTKRLLDEVCTYLNSMEPELIGFVSFTRQACEEARNRAADRFRVPTRRLHNFRTLHSMAFKMLSLKQESVVQHKHYFEIARACGISISVRGLRMNTEEGLWVGATRGDKIMFLENLARISGTTIDDALGESEFEDITKLEVDLWARNLKSYKEANALMDFTDMLNVWLSKGAIPKLKVLFVDEAQDLSKLQWQMVYKLASQECEVWIAGDDDQAIFKWSGADANEFVSIKGKRIILSQSYRVPKVIHTLAMEIQGRIEDSVKKEYAPTEEQGYLDFYGSIEQVNMDQGKWLVLVRNNYLVGVVETECRKLGYWYESLFDPPIKCTRPIINWHKFLKGETLTISELEEVLSQMGKVINLKKDYNREDFIQDYGREYPRIEAYIREGRPWFDCFENMSVEKRAYYRSVLARKENIQGTPRIRISTIHGAKGGEEDNVMLLTDMSTKTYNKATLLWSDEYRVWYVAVTRAKKTLHIIRPSGKECLPLLAV